MTPAKLYIKYKGRKGIFYYIDSDSPSSIGIIVGYTENRIDTPLIMRVINNEYGRTSIDTGDFIMDDYRPSYKYQYCSISNIIFKFGH